MKTMRPFAFASLFCLSAMTPAVAAPCFALTNWGSFPLTDQVVLVRSEGGTFMILHLSADAPDLLYRTTLDCDKELTISHCSVAGSDEHVSMTGRDGRWESLSIKTTITFETPTLYPQVTGSTVGPVTLSEMDEEACAEILSIPPAPVRGIVVHTP